MTARMELHNGTPTCFIDGKPTFLGYMWVTAPSSTGWEAAEAARAYGAAGIHFYAFDCGTGGLEPQWCGPGPGRDGDFDFSKVEGNLRQILDVDPEARFHLRIGMELQHREVWWRERYPEECQLRSDGQRPCQSFASTVWREQAKDLLRQLAAHLDSVGLQDRVIAYQTGAGGTGEWVKQDAMCSATSDYSQPMGRHFRDWLGQRYGGQEAVLRAAWANDDVTFETAAVPPPEAQLTTRAQTFRDPRYEGQVIDYYRCLAELCGDLVVDFNKTVKEATGGKALAGAFFGYLLELAWNECFFGGGEEAETGAQAKSGHLGLSRVLASPHVDFIVSPYSYGFRSVGGHGPGMPPTESARLHGKIYLYEEDSRPHLNPPDCGYGRSEIFEDSVAVLRRNMAECLCRGHGIWWLKGGAAHPHIDPSIDPRYGAELARLNKLGSFGLSLDRRPGAEIAVLLDDESYWYTTTRNDVDLPLVFQQKLWGLPRLGAPADYYLLNDFLAGKVPPARLYIFLNPWHLDGDRRAALDKELKRDGRTALWIYAPGYLKDGPGLEHMEALTGFRFGKGVNPWGPMMQITDYRHPITQGLSEELHWGTNTPLGPVFHLDDPEATVLGQVVYSQGQCRHGMGVKEMGEWNSVYVAAPNIPSPVLRGVARYAGVHLYSEAGDVLYATRQLLAVHTLSGGARQLRLPQEVEVVFDLFAERRVAEEVGQFEVELPKRSTSLFYTGDAALVREL